MKISTKFISAALLLSSYAGMSIAQTLPRPDHIVVLFEENYAYSQIIGSSSAPHINALCADTNAAVFTQFFAIEHPSQPNYLDVFSGQNQGITSDDLPTTYPWTTPNLGAEILAVGKTFTTYSEDLPSVGYEGATYTSGGANYARKHNPCSNWFGTGTNQFSSTASQPWTAFPTNYSTLPTVSFVVPNMTNDMHDYTCASLPCPESIALGDTWMYNNLDSLKKWSLANNTLYIIVYDEDDDYHGNNIPVIFYGPMVKGGTYSENVNLYNLLRTIEDIYGTTHAGNAATASPLTDCWRTAYIDAGVNKVANNMTFKVMPNPATDVINFSCSNSVNTTLQISIVDEKGNLAGSFTMTGNNLLVNTSTYAPGVYSYRIVNTTSNSIVGDGKFVVTHK